jgi:hypothetical protein
MLKNKALTLLGCLCFLTAAARAQNPSDYYEETPRTFYGGLVAGTNFTQLDGDNYAGYHHVGINAGGIVYTRFDEHLAASIEILYSQKGARAHREQGTANGDVIVSYHAILNYAEVPLQLCYFDRRRSHFGGGISISRLVSVKEDGQLANNTMVVDFDKYPFRKMDYNFILGGSLHLWEGLFLSVRFQYSLAPVRKGTIGKDLPPEYAGRNEQFNNMWTARLMYLF